MISGIAWLSTACGEDFYDINTDPLAATEPDANLLFTGAIANMSATRVIETGPNFLFFAQHWASSGAAGVFNNPQRFTIGTFGPRNTWNGLYEGGIKNFVLAIEDADSKGAENTSAQLRIIKAHMFYMLTVHFGDIPYTEAVNEEFNFPKFDPQEVVLRGVVNDIDAALPLIDPDAGRAATDGDLIYKGDMEKWRRYGNSGKLQALMLLASGGDATARGEISDLITSNAPLITAVADEANVPFFDVPENENNLWKLNNLYSSDRNIWFDAGAPLVELMNATNDPRRAIYFDEGPEAEEGFYKGRRAGNFSTDDEISAVSLNVMVKTFPDRLMAAGEVLLLRAEAYARGYVGGAPDFTKANEDLKAGMQLGVDFYKGRGVAVNDPAITAFINGFDLTDLSPENAIRTIHEQQYVNLFARGLEAWTQWRRVKVPDLPLPQQAALPEIIRRFPISDQELSANPNAAAARKPLITPMWFEED